MCYKYYYLVHHRSLTIAHFLNKNNKKEMKRIRAHACETMEKYVGTFYHSVFLPELYNL